MLSEKQAILLMKIEKAQLQNPYGKLSEAEKFDLVCQLAQKQNCLELKKIAQNSWIKLNIQQNGLTPLGFLASKGEHEAVALLISLNGEPEWVIYGYAYGGYLEQAAKWINDSIPPENCGSKNQAFKYIRGFTMAESCESFAKGLINGQHHNQLNILRSLSLINQLEVREKLAEEIATHRFDTLAILSLPHAQKFNFFMTKHKLNFNETMSLSVPGFYGWIIYGINLVQQGKLSFAIFYQVSTHLYFLSLEEIENVVKVLTFPMSYHGCRLFETICHLARAKDANELHKMIDQGADLDLKMAKLTPASFLASQGYHDAVYFLVARGANLDALFEDLCELVQTAAIKGEMEIVRNCLNTLTLSAGNKAFYYLYDETLIKAACKGFAMGGQLTSARKAEKILHHFASFKQYSVPLYSTMEKLIKSYLPIDLSLLPAGISFHKLQPTGAKDSSSNAEKFPDFLLATKF